MKLWPAIDMMNHKPVRLYKGEYDSMEVVADDIVSCAIQFEKDGADGIHLVDLDGAKAKRIVNNEDVLKVVEAVSIPVEIGGGIRDFETISYYLDRGINRVILGTSALEDEELLKKAIASYPGRIVVGIDCKNGFVCGNGWLETSKIQYIEFAKHMKELGIETVIVTDISKDGTLEGPNIKMLTDLKKEVDLEVVASGGISCMQDVLNLKDAGIEATIIGKAIYKKTLNLAETAKKCKG